MSKTHGSASLLCKKIFSWCEASMMACFYSLVDHKITVNALACYTRAKGLGKFLDK
jgi:hypothetical protein